MSLRIFIVTVEELARRSGWVQDGSLSPPNPLLDMCLVIYDLPEFLIANLRQELSSGIGRKTEGNRAFPFVVSVSKLTLRRASAGGSADIDKRSRRGKSHLVQVPAARGNVMPEIDSMSDDLPALWDPITAICGRSISLWTLRDTTTSI